MLPRLNSQSNIRDLKSSQEHSKNKLEDTNKILSKTTSTKSLTLSKIRDNKCLIKPIVGKRYLNIKKNQ